MRAREVINRIESLGGIKVRQVGSHARFKVVSSDGKVFFATVPIHPGRDIPLGTLRSIQRQLEDPLGKGWLTK
ncbi:type II toxin-antitoxin system HicA family toxin [Varibaculum massiliense]|uniref:type II toxin-antitoxin system HicA family toxin n=1 Tax=Varibaculum massiliense TaxID=1852372 RepID=UPI00288C231B|nr:type II toxin-antitoxin system HicA family toxin [Varibaculum massiliense]